MCWEALYTPDGSSTVLSPDSYLQTHPKFYRAFQQSENCDNNSSITFTDTNDKVIKSVALERNNNEQWLTKPTNQILLPSEKQKKYIIRKVRTQSATIREKSTMKVTITPTDESIEMTSEKTTTILNNNNNNNNNDDNNNIDNNNVDNNNDTCRPETKPIQNIELWHQRMGHISPRTLQATQRCTSGIPHLPTVPSKFKCLFYEKAKMMKQSGKRKSEDAFILGQVYHIDLSFVSGLSNLEDMVTCNALPKETVKRSCEGYIGFLTIIDVATRNLWTHNVKSKDPPLDYIN